MRGMGTWGVGTGNARRDRGPPAIERTRAGRQQCVWGQDLACVPGIPSFTCSLLMRLNSKKLQFPKCVWAMGIYIWWKCHLESNQSTFMVENTHHVVQWELLYLHSALRTNSVPWIGLFFLLFLCSASQNDRSSSPFDSICVTLIFHFF